VDWALPGPAGLWGGGSGAGAAAAPSAGGAPPACTKALWSWESASRLEVALVLGARRDAGATKADVEHRDDALEQDVGHADTLHLLLERGAQLLLGGLALGARAGLGTGAGAHSHTACAA